VSDIFDSKNASNNKFFTTQEFADLLNVSIPFIIKLIEEQKISAFKDGTQCRILTKDALLFKNKMSAEQLAALEELSAESEKLGLDF
jgi:excisionase family DNA binding protein